MNKRYLPIMIALMLTAVTLLSACEKNYGLDPEDPVTITMWHNYGGQMQTAMDELVDTFNDTVGKEEGIYVQVTSVTSSSVLHDKLMMVIDDDPGAAELPNITTAYPKSAQELLHAELIIDFNTYISQDDLAVYVPEFLQEGSLNTDGLYVLPTAKSTEVLFLNQTLFDRFAAETGVTIDALSGFDGLMQTAEAYYAWTDAQTPETEGDGQAFFSVDSLYYYALTATTQRGGTLADENGLMLDSEPFRSAWNWYSECALKGYALPFEGYGSALMSTGQVVCVLGSTAGVNYYPDTVTYPDGTTEKIEVGILAYPIFGNGDPVAVQRGAGMCVTKSTPKEEYASCVFLDWLTQTEQNLSFVSSTGYLPVRSESYETAMQEEIENNASERTAKLLNTAIDMRTSYTFLIPALYENAESIQQAFEHNWITLMIDEKQKLSSQTQPTIEKQILDEMFFAFLSDLQ